MTPKFGDPAQIELVKADAPRLNRGKCPLCGNEWDYTPYKGTHIYSCSCGFYGLEYSMYDDVKDLQNFNLFLTA
jgi:hypothetical protein